jgi:hypothetical protein
MLVQSHNRIDFAVPFVMDHHSSFHFHSCIDLSNLDPAYLQETWHSESYLNMDSFDSSGSCMAL